MPGHDTGNDQRKSRSNRAAAFIYANGNIGQSKNDVIPKHGNAEQRKSYAGHLSRTPLQKHNDRVEYAGGKGNHTKKKQQTK